MGVSLPPSLRSLPRISHTSSLGGAKKSGKRGDGRIQPPDASISSAAFKKIWKS